MLTVHTLPQKEKSGQSKRGRGRPRLPEEEKLRRKELRDLGLMKRSKRRTKEGVCVCVCVCGVCTSSHD